MAEIITLRPSQPRLIGVGHNEINNMLRVYVWPPCPYGRFDREFPDSDGALKYATKLAHLHKFAIHSPIVDDALWEAHLRETLEAM
ncbi:hypothetical protein BH10PSE12_BH10PSE12_01810 [soil metagenome]